MKQALLLRPKVFELQEVPIPKIESYQVLVRVHRVGICGTDIHIFRGNYACKHLPLVLGHEFSGEVVEIGRGVSYVAVGDRVTADINNGCGHCFYCRHNEILNCPEMSQLGISQQGAFREYIAINQDKVIKAPKQMPYEKLCLVEPLACVVRSLRKSGITFAQSAAVIGAGPIGNLHIQMLRAIGVAPIIALDLSPIRVDIALKSGADFAFTHADDFKKTLFKVTEGRGVDQVIESVGCEKLYQATFDYVRAGGHVVAFGITEMEATCSIKPFDMVLRELSIKGSVAGMGNDMYDALTMLAHERIQTDYFTQKTFPLSDIQTAFDTIADDENSFKVQMILS